ncbi:hypothetical protein F4X90_11175 [Candidatus Poribacteria bacterium]|nr:hypothetical protein [Candidatus Poribacteria bacterium]
MQTIYGAYCNECRDLSVMPAEKDIHIGLAKNHHNSTGHTCEVYKETKLVVLNGRTPQVLSGRRQVIATFE